MAAAQVQEQAQGQAQSTEQGHAVPIAMGLNMFLDDPAGTSREEMEGLRDGLIHVLAMLSNEIAKKATAAPTALSADVNTLGAVSVPVVNKTLQTSASLAAANRISGGLTGAPAADVEQDLKATLGLLLKHRGGPGFGGGRLKGPELAALQTRLRTTTERLRAESVAAYEA